MKSSMKTKRICMSVSGVVIGGICVAFFKLAAVGVDPFQSLMSGLDQLIPIPFGTLYVLVNAVLLIFSLVADRHYIGIATFVNLFLLGYITQFTYGLLQTIWPDPSVLIRAISLIFAIVAICFGSALYMTADLGVSTYDAVALVCANKWKLGKFARKSVLALCLPRSFLPDLLTLSTGAEDSKQRKESIHNHLREYGQRISPKWV